MSDHRDDHQMHENSLLAYYAEADNLSGRRAAVVAVYRKAAKSLRDREVMRALGFVDPNKVRPSITTLIHKGILHEEIRSAKDPDTERTVRLVSLNPRMDAAKPKAA
ncbi:MAG TPA: hypothetical protein VIY49_19215 [Bryobacteraceae bacterium]